MEEQRKPQLIVDSPSRVKMPELIVLVRAAVKANMLTEEWATDFKRIGIQIHDDEENISKANEAKL